SRGCPPPRSAGAGAPRSRSSRPPGEPGPDLRHRGRVLLRGETLPEARLHPAAEGVEVEVEGLRHEPLAPRHRGGRQGQEAPHRLLHRVREALGRHHPIHEPELGGTRGGDGFAGQHQLAGEGGPDEPGQAIERHGGNQALLHRGQPDQRGRGGEAIVAHQRELEPAAQAVAVDGGDERQRQPLDRGHRVLPGHELRQRHRAGGQGPEIDAGAEGAAGAGDDGHAQVGTVRQRGDRGAEIGDPRGVARVQHLGSIEGDPGHRPVEGERHRRGGHRAGAYVGAAAAVKACYPSGVGTPHDREEGFRMLSHEDNELLTRTGPGTPMGELLRRYWMPVVESRELEPGGRVKRVQILGERLIVFRGRSGRAGLIGEFCPHRSASFYYGRVEDAGMRCAYHGWRFGLDGQCQEMPSEPPESSFASKVRHTAYPCREAGGVIFAYLGPGPTPPPLPELEWTLLPPGHTFISRRVQDCNWFQALEGGIDSSHISFLHAPLDHRDAEITEDMDRVSFGVGAAVATGDRAPRFEVYDTDYGVVIGARRTNPDGRWYWRITQFLLPFYTMPPTDLNERVVQSHIWVPMD